LVDELFNSIYPALESKLKNCSETASTRTGALAGTREALNLLTIAKGGRRKADERGGGSLGATIVVVAMVEIEGRQET